MGLPPCKCLKAQGNFSHARAEDEKLIKELTLEVLTLKVPFRNQLWRGFRIEASWPRPNFSGIHLMAATRETIQPADHTNLKISNRRTRTRVAKSAQQATQLLSV